MCDAQNGTNKLYNEVIYKVKIWSSFDCIKSASRNVVRKAN